MNWWKYSLFFPSVSAVTQSSISCPQQVQSALSRTQAELQPAFATVGARFICLALVFFWILFNWSYAAMITGLLLRQTTCVFCRKDGVSLDESLLRRTSVPLRSSISLILLPSQIYAAINVSRFDTFQQRGCCLAALIPPLITNIEN